MKKFTLILTLFTCLSLLLASCADSGTTVIELGGDTEPEGPDARLYGFIYEDVTFFPGDLMEGGADAVIKKIGEPVTFSSSDSCAYLGLDKVYNYNGFTVYTYPDGEQDYILQIVLTDDSVSTPAGIRIGSSVEEVRAVYGEAYTEEEGIAVCASGNLLVRMVIADGAVKALTYSLAEENA